MAKKRLCIANWKMYMDSPDAALSFAKTLKRRAAKFSGVEIAIAPSFPLILSMHKALTGVARIGSQTLSAYDSGAHTGEVSAALLKKLGASFSIIGHSERRAIGESDEQIRVVMQQADAAGLRAILCVGEKERDEHGGHFQKISAQLHSALGKPPVVLASRLVIAYEPVWAIGKTATDAMKPEDLRETIIFIRKTLTEIYERNDALRVPILYGGSVEPENARALVMEGECSGFLVGHASADIDSFSAILTSCSN